jgi:TadE-like protein
VIRRLLPSSSRVRGQSLVEFALTLPILVLVVFGTVDLGRAFFQSIALENAVKEGAFLGARAPECATDTGGTTCTDPNNVEARVSAELNGLPLSLLESKCFAPGTTVFSGPGKALADCEDGDLFYVRGQSVFELVVPLIGAIVGDEITIEATATAVVVSSFSVPGASPLPIPTTAPTPSAAPGICTVPDFTAGPTKIRDAEEVWEDVAGFDASHLTKFGSNNQDIVWQTLPAGTQGGCASQPITVSSTVMSTPAPTPSPTPAPTPPPGATPTPTPAATPAPSTPAMCTVPNMRNDRVTAAQGEWSAAGFNALNFTAVRPPNDDYRVRNQSISWGSVRNCLTTTISVSRGGGDDDD